MHTPTFKSFIRLALSLALTLPALTANAAETQLTLNEQEYLEMPGLNVMLAHDFYPEGHQGGVGIIQNGLRVATNGDLRLDRTPGQWEPVPKVGEREVDTNTQSISVRMAYPDERKDRKGYNPVTYPDLQFSYSLRVQPAPEGGFHILVDLDKPLPDEWIGRVGFNLELFPGILFGKSYNMDGDTGIFPLQANGPGQVDDSGEYHIEPMAQGRTLSIAPETTGQRMRITDLNGGGLELIDGRGQHTNGWFVVRSLVPAGATSNAIKWLVQADAIPDFRSKPVIQLSQVGYHPQQAKVAVIELDRNDDSQEAAILHRIDPQTGPQPILSATPTEWGNFLRYRYLQFDFSSIKQAGMYQISYGEEKSRPFKIDSAVYQRNVWQPTLEYFLPVQMCHMRVNDRYRVWHGVCHLDDARMAPTDHNHFDGYRQGSSSLCEYKPGEHVPGLDRGGWHDAGDDDLRIESQAGTMYGLALAWEEFHPNYDNTTIDQEHRVVEIHRPDGKPDILQQIEHGALTVVGGYKSLGRLYRGIITPTKRQYTLVGDPATATDNQVFDPQAQDIPDTFTGLSGSPDDRWVFTEENPRHELGTAGDLAASYRALKGYNDPLANDCLTIARALWTDTQDTDPRLTSSRIQAAVELLISTGDREYADYLIGQQGFICQSIQGTHDNPRAPRLAWEIGRVLDLVENAAFRQAIIDSVKVYAEEVEQLASETPYGVPYRPHIWGAGWGIQRFGMQQYFLHKHFPESCSDKPLHHALEFVLGRHPGSNTTSFVSGVGSESVTVGYGFNRADWSYIPGGSVSGTALIRPDFPELLTWPFLWQQTEYVLGGGTTDYLFLVLAADHLLNP